MKEPKQLTIFNPNKYNIYLIYLSKMLKISPLQWNFEEIEKIPRKYLRILGIRYQLPYSGNQKNVYKNSKPL